VNDNDDLFDEVISRDITPQELQYIYHRYAYVQILNPDLTGEFTEIRVLRSRSGWLILDYENSIASSPGQMLFTHDTYMTTEDDTLKQICSGTGTITLQIANTAADMVRIAKEERNWPSIHIVAGYQQMKWGIWIAAQGFNLPVSGYTPSKEEENKYHRIQIRCPSLILGPSGPGGTHPSG
jgi:hypothetical protein